jgi:hypothetical protein
VSHARVFVVAVLRPVSDTADGSSASDAKSQLAQWGLIRMIPGSHALGSQTYCVIIEGVFEEGQVHILAIALFNVIVVQFSICCSNICSGSA